MPWNPICLNHHFVPDLGIGSAQAGNIAAKGISVGVMIRVTLHLASYVYSQSSVWGLKILHKHALGKTGIK